MSWATQQPRTPPASPRPSRCSIAAAASRGRPRTTTPPNHHGSKPSGASLSILSTQKDVPTNRAFKPLLQPARYKGAHGGRGSGKSHFFAEMLIDDCLLEYGM